MPSSNRNILLACLALLVVGCLCTAALGLTGAGVALVGPAFPHPGQTAQPSRPTPTRRPSSTPPPAAAGESASPAVAPTQAAVLPPGVSQQMDAIQGQVVALRGLQPTGAVQRRLITRDQLSQKIVSDFFKDYTSQDAQNDQTVLTAFGLLPPGFDLLSFYEKLYTEGIAGYYDNQTRDMYVVEDQGFQGTERLTYSHEYTHALQDQNFDIQNGLNYSEAACKHDTERCAGLQALIEGDATLVEQDWLLGDSTSLDREQIQVDARDLKTPVYNSAPAFMQQDFLFPYRSGEEFVQSLFDRGGWAAVDAAFHNPPVSTEQILHPDRYPNDRPAPVSLPDLAPTLGAGWQLANRNPLGEWYTYLVLAEGADARTRLAAGTARTAAEGWGGDAYAVYTRGGAVEAVLATAWDTAQDATQFRNAFAEYGAARWGSPALNQTGLLRWQTGTGVVEFTLQGQRTTWVMSPDTVTAQAVEAALQKK
jgi:hypothetical protein